MTIDIRENHLLRSFPPEAIQALRSSMEAADPSRGDVLYEQGQTIETVCFPVSGVVSQFQVSSYGRRIEVAMIGREGLTGVALLLGADRSPEEVCVLIPGRAVRVDGAALLDVSRKHASVRELLLRYVQAATVQKANTALSHGLDVIERRLARWLLMCRDRSAGDDLAITHDQLSTALGVRRSGVTNALHMLEGERLVRSTRGLVTLTDRAGLEATAKDSYGASEQEYARLLGDRVPG